MMTHTIHRIICGLLCSAALFAAVAAHAAQERTPGYMKIRLAVLNYEPLFASQGNIPYWQWGGWTDPRICVDMLVDGWRQMTDGMLDIEVVHWTNVNLFPYSNSQNSYGEHRFTEESFMESPSQNAPGMMNYLFALTNDFPHILPMVDRGEVDHVIVGGGPHFGYWETHMVGRGASWCNSMPTVWTNERTFTMIGMNCERPGNGAHPIGHGHGESVMAQWFWNGHLGYVGQGEYPPIVHDAVSKYTNINEFSAFTRYKRVTDHNIGLGNIHWAPNGINSGWGYDYFRDDPVYSTADNWKSPHYPHSLTNPPRLVFGREWGLTDESNNEFGFSWWWWNHFPQQMGTYRGKLNNWMTYAWNWNTASYPIGSDQPLLLDDIDLAGWFTYQIYAPPGTTQVVLHISSPEQNVHFGLRKDYIPKRFRPASSETYPAYDDWHGRAASYTRVLTADNNFGRGLEGYWYATFGNAFNSPNSRPVRTYSNVTVSVSILPKPTNETVTISIDAPVADATLNTLLSPMTNISWQVDGLPQGVRATYLYYQLTNEASEWIPICADYNFNLSSPYPWYLPSGVLSSNARVKVAVEDVYGEMHHTYSDPFILIGRGGGAVEWEEIPHVATQDDRVRWDHGQDFVQNRDPVDDGHLYVRFITGSGGDDGTSQAYWRVQADLPAEDMPDAWEKVLHVRANQERSHFLSSLKYDNTIIVNGWIPGLPGLPGYPWSIFSFWVTNSVGERSFADGVNRDNPLGWYPDNAHPKNTSHPGAILSWTSPQDYLLLMTAGSANLIGDDYADAQIRRIRHGQNTTLHTAEMTSNKVAATRATLYKNDAYFIKGPHNAQDNDGVWFAPNVANTPARLSDASLLIPYSSMGEGAENWMTPNGNRPVAIHAIAPEHNYLYKDLLIISFSASDADQRIYAFDLAAPTNGPVTLFGTQNLWPLDHDKWLGQLGNVGSYLFMIEGDFADTRVLKRLNLNAWAPAIAITNSPMIVDEGTTHVDLYITNNTYTVGSLTWQNHTTQAEGTEAVTPDMTVITVPVMHGLNTLTIQGTNVYGFPVESTAEVTVIPEPSGAIVLALAALLSRVSMRLQ